jgi:hypothetical protein
MKFNIEFYFLNVGKYKIHALDVVCYIIATIGIINFEVYVSNISKAILPFLTHLLPLKNLLKKKIKAMLDFDMFF